MEKLTFLELAKKVLTEENRPLAPSEIWNISVSKGYDSLIGSQGKTPAATSSPMTATIRGHCKPI
jgi:uncharacterized protein